MATERACLLIADVSGYTGYLAAVELDHAHDILADLMNTIVTSLRPGFHLAKLEGDAVFTFAITEKIDGSLLLDTIERCYFGFRRRRRDIRQSTSCECNACVRIPDLNLKFVVHHGTILRQRVAGHDELLGGDVILVHRLLKNDVVASTGIEAYALLSQQSIDAMDLDVAALGMLPAKETYEHIGDVSLWIHDLERRWQEEEARARVMVDEATAIFEWHHTTTAPPQIVWEFWTAPGRRPAWQVGVTGIETTSAGNRRGPGTTNHCRHGAGVSVEEILDWRPFEYVTLWNTIPTAVGPVRLLETTEFEPTPGGTTIRMRFAAPETPEHLAALEQMRPYLDEALQASGDLLTGQLAAELKRQTREAPDELALPQPRPDGLLAPILSGRQPDRRAQGRDELGARGGRG